MGLAEKYIPHYTYDDWFHWEGRWELIEGIPVAMSPMPLPEHQRVASELGTQFTLAIRKSECKDCRVYQPIDYKIKEDTIVEPDLLIVCGKITKRFLDFPPALIVEILSKSTEEKDRGIKFDYYQQEGVKYYLLVDVNKKTIETYELISGVYLLQNLDNRFEFQLNGICSVRPELLRIWDGSFPS
jgi:Uma2 family endonuclease